MSEQAGIQVCDVGRVRALEKVLSSGLPPLYRRAYRLLGNAAHAEDAVQDALLAAYTHLNQFKGQSQLGTWLTSIVLNCARLHLRRRQRHVNVPLDESIGEARTRSVEERLVDHRANPEDRCSHAGLSRSSSRFHSQLSPTLRKTFQLRDIDGRSIREPAQILGVPSGTVKAQAARACKKLKALMRYALRPRSRRLQGRPFQFANPAS